MNSKSRDALTFYYNAFGKRAYLVLRKTWRYGKTENANTLFRLWSYRYVTCF